VQLDQIFRLEQTRTVSNDWVVRYANRLLQLERQSQLPPARSTVLVREAIDGELEIQYRGHVMRWTEISLDTKRSAVTPMDTGSPARATIRRSSVHPAPRSHPWRKDVGAPVPPIWRVWQS